MPVYDYQCPKCGKVKENVIHTIAELVTPSATTTKEITCRCTKKGTRMTIAYLEPPSIKTPTRNRFLDTSRKKRNHNHFKKEVLPTMDKDLKRHHLAKMGKK